MAFARPSFAAAWNRFKEINAGFAEVVERLGGHVLINISSGNFRNVCPIRMSYVLNHCGASLPRPGTYTAVSGRDHRWHMYKRADIKKFLDKSFGKADVAAAHPTPSFFPGKRGILNSWGAVATVLKYAAGLIWILLCSSLAAQQRPDDLPEADSFSQADMYTHWIEHRCIGRLGYGKALTGDAYRSAAAWLQFGNLPIEAYNQGDELIDSYLKIKLGGSVPGEFKVLQCTLIAATPAVKKIFDRYEAISLQKAAGP